MNECIIWHNPRCAKSRAGLKYLLDRGIEPRIVKYLDEPPSEETLGALLGMLGISARGLMRTKEPLYRELGLKEIDDEKLLIAAMAEHPKLIERSVVIYGNRAVIARPAEAVEKLLN